MLEGSVPAAPSPFLALTILVDRQEAYEFMLRCGEKATVGGIMAGLEKTYDAGMRDRAVFRDRECSVLARPEEQVLKTARFYLGFTYAEYETIVKTLFFAKPHLENPSELKGNPEQNMSKIENENLSTAEKMEVNSPSKQVSDFEISIEKRVQAEQKVEAEKRIVEAISPPSKPNILSPEPKQTHQNPPKIYPEVFDSSQNQIQASDSLQRPQTVASGSCCALI